jgi:hypothetical protein
VFILKEVKVVCFDTLLQVLILKNFYWSKIVQNAVWLAKGRWQGSRKQKRQQDAGATGVGAQYYPPLMVRNE